jgi:hypothetical protein
MSRSEDSIQEAVLTWWNMACRGFGCDSRLLHHSPNGGTRRVREAMKFKRMGVRAGFPDLFLAVPRELKVPVGKGVVEVRSFHGLFVEMKSENGRLSLEQKAFHPLLEAQGFAVMTAWSFEEAVTYITNYLTHGAAFVQQPPPKKKRGQKKNSPQPAW